ncbi:LLM class flavin-dependent oxidoreductase [Homoserinibacter sp. GY 40078]|uniref:LLM class flavin-dependent oxidoreductase n=1 Tax=Homoserinibacter sp. GY 40078 TaxID=2603275 RepID=UPI00164F0A66|nr:LLM class flavin-dependent oxidoreductase [Homoserinibacter sp. GY 40078]
MKKLGFLSFGYWSSGAGSQVRSAKDSLVQSVELAVAAEEIGIDGAYFRIHHYADQQMSPFPLLSTIAAKTTRLEFGTGVIDMRYENPLYLAEEAAELDLLSGERLQLGVSRGSPEHADRGYRYFGHVPREDQTDAEMAREHTDLFLRAIEGEPIADPNPMFGRSGKLPITPQSATLRERVWWGAGNLDTAVWAASQGLQLMSSTLIMDEKGLPFDELQLEQIEGFRAAWRDAGWSWAPQVSVSRSITPIVDDLSAAVFGHNRGREGVGQIEGITSRFGPQFAGPPEQLVDQLRADVALQAADMVLLTVPNQLGVEFNARQLEAVRAIGDELGWSAPAVASGSV